MLGMSRPNLNKMKKASHYHREVEELKVFTLTKVMELLVIPKEEIVDFLDGYMITPSSTCREVREAVSAWKDDNVVADAEITDADESTVVDETEEESTVVDEATESSTSNNEDDALAPIKNLIDTLNRDELLSLKEYIEKRL